MKRTTGLPWRVGPFVRGVVTLAITWAMLVTVATAAPLTVVVSIPPLAMVVAPIGGPQVAVHSLMPGGASPHQFSPTPAIIRELGRASLFVAMGGGIDLWAERAAAQVRRPYQARLTLLPTGVGSEHHHGHADGENPHRWLDPVWVREQLVPQVTEALVAADPQGESGYRARAAAFSRQLQALHESLTAMLAPVQSAAFVAFHDAMTPLADRYGLRQVGVVEVKPGQEPSIRSMRMLIRSAKLQQVQAVLIEPQFNPQAARTIAKQLGARVVTVDPMGGPGTAAGDHYIHMMNYNVQALVQGLRR